MDHKKIIAVSIGVLAAVVLFSVVYTQFSVKDAMAPSMGVVQQQKKMVGEANPVAPITDPETVADITMAIDAQLAEDAKAFDAEIAAETAAIDGDLTSLNELNDTYDETAY